MTRTKSIFRFVALALILAGAMSCGQTDKVAETGELSWPEITRQNKPWTRWWWPASAVGQSDIDDMLHAYSEANLGGVEVTTIYGAKGYEDQFIDYLTPEWMDLFEYTLKGAESRDMGVDLANASGWPFGGPWVPVEDACRYLASKSYKVKGGEVLSEKIEYVETPLVRALGGKLDISEVKYPITANDNLQQKAFEQVRYPQALPLIAVTAHSATGQYMELTELVSEDGQLEWTAPEGDWTVCALFLGWHGKMVERAGPGGEGDVIDHFSGRTITNYLKKFDEAFEGYDVSTLRYYFNDSYEVDDAFGNSDWTEEMFEEFAARRGYDLKPYMAHLLGLTDDVETADRVRFDYRTTIGELLLEKYSVIWQEWAAAQGKGIRNQAHGSPANILDLYSVSDVPETEGKSIIGMKTASSSAHVTDKPLTSSESCTWLNDHFRSDLADVKVAVDRDMLSGVNHLFYHGTCMSPTEAQWPGWMFYAAVHFQPTNPFWKDFSDFNRYVAHCQSFLQQGRPDNDILLFFNATDLMSVRGREPMLFHMNHRTPEESAIGESARYLYNKGYTWDYITDKMIVENIDVKGGDIVTRGGNRYQTLILPECRKMELATFEKLVSMARKGATIMVENALPSDVPGFADLEARRDAFAKLAASLEFTSEGEVSIAAVGKGRILVSKNLDAMLDVAGITREKMYDLGMQSISRTKADGGKFYFIKNATTETIEGWIPVDVECRTIGIYNPMTEALGYGKVRQTEGGKAEVYMKILPEQTFILETFAGEYTGENYKFYQTAGEPVAVESEWDVEFVSGGPALPAAKSVKDLESWTKWGKAYEIFSGTAVYTTVLPAVEASADAWTLDLGNVRESVKVYLNDELLGTLFGEPFALTIPAEKLAQGGTLKLVVSNSMENRISYMDRENITWRIFYNVNFQARMGSVGPDGLFSAAKWAIEDAGLIGPVTLTPSAVVE